MKANVKLGNKLEAKTRQKQVEKLTGNAETNKRGTLVPTILKVGGKTC